MSAHPMYPSLRSRLFSYLWSQTGDGALCEELVRRTLVEMESGSLASASAADLLTSAFRIARTLLADSRRHAQASCASAIPDLGVLRPFDQEGRFASAMRRYKGGDGGALGAIDELLAPPLFVYFVHRTGDPAASRAHVRNTLLELRARPPRYATASDLVSCAIAIARSTLDALARTPGPPAAGPGAPAVHGSLIDRCIDAGAVGARESEPMCLQPMGVTPGPNHPTWRKLYESLEKLASTCGGPFAFVVDAGNVLWCMALAGSKPDGMTSLASLRAAKRFHEREIAPRLPQMRRGKRFTVAHDDGEDCYAAASFAGIYALVVWLETELDPAHAHSKIQRALPEVEAHTLALPPSSGPGRDRGAARVRA